MKERRRILILAKESEMTTSIRSAVAKEEIESEIADTLEGTEDMLAEDEYDTLVVEKEAFPEDDFKAFKKFEGVSRILVSRRPSISDIDLYTKGGFEDYVALTHGSMGPFDLKSLGLAIRWTFRGKPRPLSGANGVGNLLLYGNQYLGRVQNGITAQKGGRLQSTADINEALRIVDGEEPNVILVEFDSPASVEFLQQTRIHSTVPIILIGDRNRHIPEYLFWYFDYFMLRPFKGGQLAGIVDSISQNSSWFRMPQLRARTEDELAFNVYLVGPHGAGKSTLARLLTDPGIIVPIADRLSTLEPYARYITRNPFPGETEGIDYRFIPDRVFDDLLRQGRIREFYTLNDHTRVGADIPLPTGMDFLIAPALEGFEKMAPNDPHSKAIFFGVSWDTMKGRQLQRAEMYKITRIPETEEQWRNYLHRFHCCSAGGHFANDGSEMYDLMLINENVSDSCNGYEGKLNTMRRNALRLAWFIKYQRENEIVEKQGRSS